jgi:hypothetical protein
VLRQSVRQVGKGSRHGGHRFVELDPLRLVGLDLAIAFAPLVWATWPDGMALDEHRDPGGRMSQPIVYVDTSEVRPGRLEELKAAMNDLARFVQANEPQLFAYNVYFNDDGTRMSVLHINPDSASLELHMKVAGPKFPPIGEFIRLLSIDVYGRPDDGLVEALRQKAEMLGSGTVRVHDLHAGFARLPKAQVQ